MELHNITVDVNSMDSADISNVIETLQKKVKELADNERENTKEIRDSLDRCTSIINDVSSTEHKHSTASIVAAVLELRNHLEHVKSLIQ